MAIPCTVHSWYFIIATIVLLHIGHCSIDNDHGWQYTVLINPFNGTRNDTCYNSGGGLVMSHRIQITCEDINAGFHFRNSSTKFILRPGMHYLHSPVRFNSVNQLAIVGDNGSNSTVVCRTGTGFSFINSTDITLQWVTYVGCGVLKNSTSDSFSTGVSGQSDSRLLVGLYFYQCHDVIFNYITIANSLPNALIMYDTDGSISIANSIFCNKSLLDSNYRSSGGSSVGMMTITGSVQSVDDSSVQQVDTVSNDTYDYDCSNPYPYRGQLKCYVHDNIYKVDVRNGFWIGNTSNSNTTLMGECRYYCRTGSKENFYPLRNVSDLNSYVCGVNHRTGVLCGECIENYGPAVNSWNFTCVACSDSDVAKHIIVYIFSTYVPLFFLFLAIILFKVQLTTGPANAFVLYAQMISSAFDVSAGGVTSLNSAFSHYQLEWMMNSYFFVYGIFNLEFFSYLLDPYCLIQRFNYLDIFQIQYYVALFPLFMIIAVVLVLKLKESCFRRCFRHCTQPAENQGRDAQGGNRERNRWRFTDNLLHAFVAFTLLSYTKFGTSSTFILSTTDLFDVDGRTVGAQRVYLAGQYTVTDKRYHYEYALPAIIVLATFVALPPLLLLGPLQWFNRLVVPRVSCLRRYWPSIKVNIVLDAFQGCYKPHTRFFAGLYFLFRVAALVNYATTSYLFQQYIVQQILATVMVALLVIFQPYRRQLFNYVDTLIFLNMAVLNALSTFILVSSETNPQAPSPKITFVILYILLFLPLVYMISYFFYHVIIRNRKRIAIFFLKLWWRCKKRDESNQPLLQTANQVSYSDLDLRDDTHLFARAEEANTFRPRLSIQRAMGLGTVTSTTSTKRDENCNSRSSRTLKLSNQDSGLTSRSANTTPSVTSQSMGASHDSLLGGNDSPLEQ